VLAEAGDLDRLLAVLETALRGPPPRRVGGVRRDPRPVDAGPGPGPAPGGAAPALLQVRQAQGSLAGVDVALPEPEHLGHPPPGLPQAREEQPVARGLGGGDHGPGPLARHVGGQPRPGGLGDHSSGGGTGGQRRGGGIGGHRVLSGT
jgi:translation initiation factor IF-2